MNNVTSQQIVTLPMSAFADAAEEVSAAYAAQHGIVRDDAWLMLKLAEEVGELTQAFLMLTGQARVKGHTVAELRDGFAGEVADVLCHVLLLARRFGADVDAAVENKWLVWRDRA